MAHDLDTGDDALMARVGPVEIDWPRTVGYFGGAAAAVAFGIIEPPLGLIIAAAPLGRMLNRPGASSAKRFLYQIFEGAVKPIGGDDEGTIRLATDGTGGRGRRRAPGRTPASKRNTASRRAPRRTATSTR